MPEVKDWRPVRERANEYAAVIRFLIAEEQRAPWWRISRRRWLQRLQEMAVAERDRLEGTIAAAIKAEA